MQYPHEQFQELNHCLNDVEHQIEVIRDAAHKLCFADDDEKQDHFKKLVRACDDLKRFGFKFEIEAILAKSMNVLNYAAFAAKTKEV